MRLAGRRARARRPCLARWRVCVAGLRRWPMDETASVELIEALARIWTAIRCNHPEVPPVILLAAPSPYHKGNVLGHFSALRWKPREQGDALLHEVLVVAEFLNRPAAQVAETLLHEAAHAMNFAAGRRDCSASQYHNSWFKEAAQDLGLDVHRVANYGYAYTTLPEETATSYCVEIEALQCVLVHRMADSSPRPPSGPTPTSDTDEAPTTSSRNLKATCACGFIIRTSKLTLSSTVIRCETCDSAFASI